MSDNDEQGPDAERLKSTPPAPFLKGEPPLCSFCGRGKGEYRQLVTAPKGNICDRCVADARQQLGKGGKAPA